MHLTNSERRLGLNVLLHFYGLGTNRHKDAMRCVYPVDEWCWHRRPLPAWMVEYAVADVQYLLALRGAMICRLLASAAAVAVDRTPPIVQNDDDGGGSAVVPAVLKVV